MAKDASVLGQHVTGHQVKLYVCLCRCSLLQKVPMLLFDVMKGQRFAHYVGLQHLGRDFRTEGSLATLRSIKSGDALPVPMLQNGVSILGGSACSTEKDLVAFTLPILRALFPRGVDRRLQNRLGS